MAQIDVRQQLDQFKQQVSEAAAQVTDLETLVKTLEDKIAHVKQQIHDDLETLTHAFEQLRRDAEDFGAQVEQDATLLVNGCTAAQKEYQDESDKVQQGLAQCVSDNDQYEHQIEEHDHTVDQHIQDAKKLAEEAIQKAKDVAHGVVDTAKTVADKVVHGVEDGAKAVGHAAHEAYDGASSLIKQAAEGLLAHGNDWGSLVRDQAQHLGDNVHAGDQQTQQQIQEALHGLADHLGGNLDKMLHGAEQFAHGVGTVMDTVTTLTGHGVQTVDTLTEAMNATNVGLNTVTGIFTKAKQDFQDVASLW